ncbi:bifunctional molybdenum cofactor biosynthesis protein MoaC/MoaB [Galbibacter mesophilus]|uniref:bifunctional molybdenum cofactor biosynthesis protein MoaC/MoaB n=1 Tax=Galbibacter mesophilus TaxID=379069 RepID=UPI00191F22E4|nr:bifunctional molybdenum cofactor biosynthesis protein MoaC/MoaB [Galbibacter mesophilus]MCM5663522.1 bifunctional molybdenum cofactor biosynthesis protein MoaC/MoaB [Galbibacter mesophilus]
MIDTSNQIKTLCISTAEVGIQLEGATASKYTKEVFFTVKSAAQLAVKNAFTLIPDLLPAPINSIEVTDNLEGQILKITVTVKAIHSSNLDSEALLGASVASITLTNMLSENDNDVVIDGLKIIKSKSGLKGFKRMFPSNLKAAVIVCSDSISEGKKEDRAGKAIIEKLKEDGVEVSHYEIIPDEKDIIAEKARSLSKTNNLLIYTGGTGLSFRDVTPEALTPLLERNIPGIEEAIRSYGQERMPFAMLSRSIAGTIGNCLVLALPGSTNGAKESMDAIFPHVLHVFKILRGHQHDE